MAMGKDGTAQRETGFKDHPPREAEEGSISASN